jgi:hypothetical protein
MLADIVIDANVFLHVENDQEIRQRDCQRLVVLLRESETTLCVDLGFELEESKNRSYIGSEYWRHLRVGSPGYEIVSYLARSGRMAFLSHHVPPAVVRHVRQIAKGPDRVYVRVAFNSQEKVLASHDFGDIPGTVRERLRKAIGVSIVDAEEAIAAFEAQS